jgi:hypothetical protein
LSLNLLFFSHNKRHYHFFKAVGHRLTTEGNSVYGVRHINDSDHVVEDPAEAINLQILSVLEAKCGENSNLTKIADEYPHFNVLQALVSDRTINYYPRYLGLPKIPINLQHRYLSATFEVFERYLDTHPTDLIISELIIGLQDAVLQAIAEKRGIRYWGMRASKLSKGIVFCDPYTEVPHGFEDTLSLIQTTPTVIPPKVEQTANEHLEKLKGEYSTPEYMKETKRDAVYLEPTHIKRFAESISSGRFSFTQAPFLHLSTRQKIYYRLFRMQNLFRLRSRRGRQLFSEPTVLDGKKYLIFPLQFEPEATTLVRGFPYVDQVGIVKMIAKLLPRDMLLAVKEHRGNEGYRKFSDYRELYYEPNVVLLQRKMDVRELIINSVGVVTVSSRMGWEAMACGKPAYVLGRAFWSCFFGAQRIEYLEELRELLANPKENAGTIFHDNHLRVFAAAYIMHTYPGVFLGKSPSLLTEENVTNVSSSIEQCIKDLM